MTAWQVASLQLVLVFALARLLELGASAVRLRLARRERGARPAREPWWPAIVGTHVFVLGGTALSVWLRPDPPPYAVAVVALGALVVATALRFWIFFTLRDRWNVRVVDPGVIETGGPYRFIRHPNYLAVILEVAALPLAVGAWHVALWGSIANAIVLALRIPFEERELVARHPAYREIMMARPRFLPRVVFIRNAHPDEGGRDAAGDRRRL